MMAPRTDADAAIAVAANDAPCPADDEDAGWVEAVGTNHADRSLAVEGCDRLLRAHLETGAHWIHDPRRLAAARLSVGLPA